MLHSIYKRSPVIIGYTVLCALALHAHLRAGFALPIPWGDEALFVWQAISIKDHWSLVSENLIPFRPMMLQPPGYPVLMGIIFKFTGFSFELVRMFSLVFALLAGGFLLCSIQNRFLQFAALLLLFRFHLDSAVILSSNVARMETLILLVALGSLYIALKYDILTGLALSFLGPLMHPNGAYFALGFVFIAIYLIYQNRSTFNISRLAIGACAFVSVCYILYGIHIYLNYDSFLGDMSYQFRIKLRNEFVLFTHVTWVKYQLYFFIAAILISIHKRYEREYFCLLVLGFFSKVIVINSYQFWYESFSRLGDLVLALFIIRLLFDLAPFITRLIGENRVSAFTVKIAATLALPLLLVHEMDHWVFKDPFLKDHTSIQNERMGMTIEEQGVPYLSAEERKSILSNIMGRLDDPSFNSRKPTVRGMASIGLFFYPHTPRYFIASRLHGLYAFRVKYDFTFFHTSRYKPKWLRSFRSDKKKLEELGLGPDSVIVEATNGEKSYLRQLIPPGRG
jgi:hypothetical protein